MQEVHLKLQEKKMNVSCTIIKMKNKSEGIVGFFWHHLSHSSVVEF